MTLAPEAQSDLAVMISLARLEADGKLVKYYPGLTRAFARTIIHLVDHPGSRPEKVVSYVHSEEGRHLRDKIND